MGSEKSKFKSVNEQKSSKNTIILKLLRRFQKFFQDNIGDNLCLNNAYFVCNCLQREERTFFFFSNTLSLEI